MPKNLIKNWGEKIAKQNNFLHSRKIYQARTQTNDQIRNVIYSGLFKKKPAILKIYNEGKSTDEPLALEAFNRLNRSKNLKAPKLFKYKILSLNSGWLIEQELILGKFLKSPLSTSERQEFLKVYLEYRKTFPTRPHRNLLLNEKLTANLFHLHRIPHWLQMAINKEEKNQNRKAPSVLLAKEFAPRFEKGLEIINREFKNRKMLWCHGHFKPKEIFKGMDGRYYLTDFAHVKMYPEGYELAFMVWADWLMPGDWKLPYAKWKKPVFAWIKDLKKLAKVLKIKRFNDLIKASLIERIFGAILADVVARDWSLKEKRQRLKLLYKLFDELVKP
ncbi:MAG: hypothetical protein WCT08_06135 [Patescibacteria group bacterium]|jgi:hypothetical protein